MTSPFCQLTEGCENYREGNTLGCASCNAEARKEQRAAIRAASKAKPVPLKRTRVAKVSEKKRRDLVLYAPLKKQFLLDKPACELNFRGCTKKAIEPHHKSTSERDFLNTETWISVCRNCHEICEGMAAQRRRELGYLIDSPSEEKRTI